jgi:hypothetical protein
MEHTEFALSEIDGNDLEDLAINLLTRQDKYRGLDPQGGRGKDGGKDALLLAAQENVIVHVSRREDWKQKLEEDLDKAAGHNRTYGTFVFFTNRVISGNQKPVPEVAKPYSDEYGWGIDIWDRERISAALDNNHQDLRQKHLRIVQDDDPSELASQLIDRRLSIIRRQDVKLPEPVRNGPKTVLHVVPHKPMTNNVELTVEDLPEVSPPAGKRSSRKTVDGRVVFAPGHSGSDPDPQFVYSYMNKAGWFEYIDTVRFNRDKELIASTKFEKEIGKMFEDAIDSLHQLALNGPVEVCISLLSVEGYSFATGPGSNPGRTGPKSIRQTDVEGEPYTVDDPDGRVGPSICKGLNRVWRSAGWSNGSPNFDRDGWKFENTNKK